MHTGHFSDSQYVNLIVKLVLSAFQIGALKDLRWQSDGRKTQEGNNIAIQVTPPDGEEDDEIVPPLRARRKLSSPLSGMPNAEGGLTGPGNYHY